MNNQTPMNKRSHKHQKRYFFTSSHLFVQMNVIIVAASRPKIILFRKLLMKEKISTKFLMSLLVQHLRTMIYEKQDYYTAKIIISSNKEQVCLINQKSQAIVLKSTQFNVILLQEYYKKILKRKMIVYLKIIN